jgi:hypothetical protein
LGQLVAAYGLAREIVAGRKDVFANLKRTWEKSRYPKGQEVNGRKFVHVLDDVKDHWADRRADLSYMIAPKKALAWRNGWGSWERPFRNMPEFTTCRCGLWKKSGSRIKCGCRRETCYALATYFHFLFHKNSNLDKL